MSSYVAANGQEITEAMLDRWCDAYEQGEFPAGERTVGKVVMGRPPLSSGETVTLGIKVPSGMRAALASKAKQKGVTMSAYARDVLARDLMGVG